MGSVGFGARGSGVVGVPGSVGVWGKGAGVLMTPLSGRPDRGATPFRLDRAGCTRTRLDSR